jgi:hypothetical protein
MYLITTPWRHVWEWGIAPPFLTTAVYGGEWIASHPDRFTPPDGVPSTHWIRVWMGPRVGRDTLKRRKISYPCRKSNPGHPARSLVVVPTELSRLYEYDTGWL